MKRVLSAILVLFLVLSICPDVYADAVPPGLKRPPADYMKNLCSQANSKAGATTTWDYDEKSGALVLLIPYGTTQSLISVVKDADAGDSTASLFVTLLDKMGKDMCDTMAQQFYDMGYYVNIVVRYTDDLQENTVGAEYIDGVRSAFRPE